MAMNYKCGLCKFESEDRKLYNEHVASHISEEARKSAEASYSITAMKKMIEPPPPSPFTSKQFRLVVLVLGLSLIFSIIAMLTPGTRGDVGDIGPQGIVGPPGPVGVTGPIGPAGVKGPIGAQGAQGTQGPTGPVGPTGTAGSTGPVGYSDATLGLYSNNYNPARNVAFTLYGAGFTEGGYEVIIDLVDSGGIRYSLATVISSKIDELGRFQVVLTIPSNCLVGLAHLEILYYSWEVASYVPILVK